MIPFNEFTLSNLQLEYLKRAVAKRKIRKYIEENGTEPDNISSFFSYDDADLLKYKKILYAMYSVNEVPVLPKPEANENTPEQDAVSDNIIDAIDGSQSSYTAGEEEIINNFTVPATAPKSFTVNGPVQSGATIDNESSRSITINNTGDAPIDITVSNSSPSATFTFKGDEGYNDIYAESNKVTVSAPVYGTVVLAPVDDSASMSVGAAWQDDSTLTSNAGGRITVSNSNSANEPSVNINTPNATIVMTGGQYDVLDVTCADNTLEISGAFHAKKLILKKGKVLCGGGDISYYVDELVTEDDNAVAYSTYEISNASIAGLSKNGISNLVEDVVSTSRVGFGIFASGHYRYNMNGHSITLKGGTSAAMYFRGSGPTIDIYGPGKIIESGDAYGIWTGSETTTVNIYDCDVEAHTHVLYAYSGTINVYGGSFKLLDETPDLDPNGHHKFLLNCYDANYTNGTAKINVYGGKFYNFNPAVSYSEPGGPVSFVADGYHVVESVEDGVPVFEVVPDDLSDSED